METTWMEKLLVRKIPVFLYILFGGGALMFGAMAISMEDGRLIAGGFAVLNAALCYILATVNKRQYTKWLDTVVQSGNLSAMLQDFDGAYTLLGGDVRLGKYWLFGKGANRAFTYQEIVKTYQYVHRTNGVEDSRQMKAICADGKEHVLFDLPRRGKADAELTKIVNVMLHYNPKIHVGYK